MVRSGLWLIALGLVAASLLLGAGESVELVLNPYAGVNFATAEALRTNLHTHTTESDGIMPPARVIAEYQARGYRALAITDHNRTTWPWQRFGAGAAADAMVAVPGNELSRHHHTLSLFTPYETPASDWTAALDGLAAAGGVGIVCHPAMHWPHMLQRETPTVIAMTEPLAEVTRGDFTVACWFRTTDPGRHLLLGNYESGKRGALNLELHTENRVRLYVEPPEGTIADLNVAAGAHGVNTRDGQWHHLAGLRRGHTVQLYLDGRPVGELADTAGAYRLRGDRYYLGRDHRTGATELQGDLDDAALWRRALTADEVARLVAGEAIHDGLLLNYMFETSGGRPVVVGPASGQLDDGQQQYAIDLGDGGRLSYLAEVPPALAATGRSRFALRFGAAAVPGVVPDEAVAIYTGMFQKYPNLAGIEVWNGTRPTTECPLDRALWDRLLTELMPSRPVWGVANDDTHQMGHLGRDWTVMLCPTADAAGVRQALTTGAFYFSTTRLTSAGLASPYWTPRLEAVEHDPGAGTLRLWATQGGEPLPDDSIVWLSAGAEVARGPVLDYRTTQGLRRYVRAELTGVGGMTCTQPFGIE